jgi:hypothetical protein
MGADKIMRLRPFSLDAPLPHTQAYLVYCGVISSGGL